jgi:hypothetical protein
MNRLLLVGLVVAGWTAAVVAQAPPTPMPPVGAGAGAQGTVTGQPGAAGVQGGLQGTVTGQPGTAGVQGGLQGAVTGQPGTAGVGGTGTVTGQAGVPGMGGTVGGGLSGQGTTTATGTGLVPVPGQPGMYYQQNTYGGYSPYGGGTGYYPGTMTGYPGNAGQGGYYAPSVVGGGMMQAGYPSGAINGVVTGNCGMTTGYSSYPSYSGYDSTYYGGSTGGRRGRLFR